MQDFVDITLVANAGVLVSRGGVGVLVDGMHREDGHPFSKVAESDLVGMRLGMEPYVNLDYLLFTHEHADHFTPRLVLEHLRARRAKGLLLPGAGSPDLARLIEHLRANNVPHQTLSLDAGRTRCVDLGPELRVTVIGTRHMGPQYQQVRNDCLLMSIGGVNLLFTGDADHVASYFETALRDVSLDAVFVNPIFYHNPQGQAIITEIFRPRTVVIYHMPFAADDTMNFAYMVRRDMEKHEQNDIETHVLREEKQRLRLGRAS